MYSDLLFELGCEELPSASVLVLAEAFEKHLLSSLEKANLTYGKVQCFATPRRIGLFIGQLQAEQASQTVTRRGPALAAAYDADGKPTKALAGFAQSCGVDPQALTVLKSDKGDWLVYESVQAGEPVQSLLPSFINQALAALPIAKPMRWGNEEVEFVRPVHWAVLLYGDELIEADILGLQTSRESRGHRFHHNQRISIQSPASYEAQLREARVIADFTLRRKAIIEQVQALAEKQLATAVMPEALVDEVTSIVEWPKALLAHFNKDFLEVPSEALIASMQAHQKCFALRDKADQLLPCFITVSNIDSKDENEVVKGNEKVMRARLSDAAFFFHQDKKQALSSHIEATAKVIFQVRLGSLQDKARRIQALMKQWSNALNLKPQQAERAAVLSKCDLMTGMVGEFPELQGLMGYYYALNDGEDHTVAVALDEQYLPRFSGDLLPESSLGRALSLADRLDTLVGIFAIGQKPSGVKDPFKLRRHALAIVRILASTPAKLQLSTLISEAMESYQGSLEIPKHSGEEIKSFILDRLHAFYHSQGFSVDLLHAVRACQDEWLYDFEQRLLALKTFISLPEASSLSAACKRVNNILSGVALSPGEVSSELLKEEEEKTLYQQLKTMDTELKPSYALGDYMTILARLASMRDAVDAFFDKVMVMVDDPALKDNRLKLLTNLQSLLMAVADISLLQIQHSE